MTSMTVMSLLCWRYETISQAECAGSDEIAYLPLTNILMDDIGPARNPRQAWIAGTMPYMRTAVTETASIAC
jgi:hypothetical protein